MAEILERHQKLPPAPARLACPELPEGLAQLLMRMLEKDPAARPAQPEEILAAFSAVTPAPPGAAGAAKGAAAPKPLARSVPQKGPAPPPSPAGIRPARRGGPRRPAPLSAPPAKEPRHRIPLAAQILLWPALWAALFVGGRYLMLALLERLAR